MTIELEAKLKLNNMVIKSRIDKAMKDVVSKLVRILKDNLDHVQYVLALFQYDLKSIGKDMLKVLEELERKVLELLRKCGISERTAFHSLKITRGQQPSRSHLTASTYCLKPILSLVSSEARNK